MPFPLFIQQNKNKSVSIIFCHPLRSKHLRVTGGIHPPARLEPVTLFLRYLESTTLSLDEGMLSIFGAQSLEKKEPLVK